MLFNVLPGNFFSVLSSKNKTLYWECIFKLFTITSKRLSFGLNRDDAIDELAFYLDSALATDLEFDENDFAEERIGREACTTVRDKAALILRHLTSCGWLSVERIWENWIFPEASSWMPWSLWKISRPSTDFIWTKPPSSIWADFQIRPGFLCFRSCTGRTRRHPCFILATSTWAGSRSFWICANGQVWIFSPCSW